MDEPTASLDEDAVDMLIGILAELKAAGKTLIVVTHDARLIARVADQLCVVATGKVSGFGPAAQVAPLVGGELYKSIRAARSADASLDGREGRA
jgi:ABC-type sugar transport system ATPase subunit